MRLRATTLYAATLAGCLLAARIEVRAQQCPDLAPPFPLNRNACTDLGDDNYPHVASNGDGAWVATWSSTDDLEETIGMDPDIIMARLSDNATIWTDPEPLSILAHGDSLGDYNPQVVYDGMGTWLAVWDAKDQFGSRDATDLDVMVARSVNNGAAWTLLGYLNTTGPVDQGDDRNPRVATNGLGNWVAVWWSDEPVGGSGPDADIMVATSVDAAATWSDAVPLNTNANSDQRTDQFPQITTDGSGVWLAVWESHDDSPGADPPGEADILCARSFDNGVTWSAPAAVNTNAANDEGQDMRPQIATDRKGTWVVVWHSTDTLNGIIEADEDILFARSTNNGIAWSEPTWLNRNALNDNDFSSDVNPQIATDGQKHWIAVWAADGLGGGFDMDVKMARSQDHGATWSPPRVVNANATADTGDDDLPIVTTNGVGDWIIAWQSNEVGDGTLGDDFDILATTFRLTPFDCNLNDTPDECDIAAATSDDCNANGIPDECEIDAEAVVDCSSTPPPCREGPFFCEADCLNDLDSNGIPDCCEVGTCVPCPPGLITWVDPPDGVIDAGQPHALDDAGVVQGIVTIEVTGPPTARRECWTLCETATASADNFVAEVDEDPPGTYALTLDRPITAGELTTLTYTDFVDVQETASFSSLPGDVNADRVTNADDLTAMVDACFNGTASPPFLPPHDRYNCDLDRSGATTTQDLVRLIDLLNAAGEFASWQDATVPETCP